MTREEEIMAFLHMSIFDPILNSTKASEKLKSATRGASIRFKQRNAQKMIEYFWAEIVGTPERSTKYGRLMKGEGFTQFEEIADEFRVRMKDI